jgi:hypothetical protein
MAKNPKRKSKVPKILDEAGWHLGLKAVFKHAFGTDTETEMEAEVTTEQKPPNGGSPVSEDIDKARRAITEYHTSANLALKHARRDPTEQTLLRIIKDL